MPISCLHKRVPGKAYVTRVCSSYESCGRSGLDGPFASGPIEITALVQPPFDIPPLLDSTHGGKQWLLVPDDPEVCARPDVVRATRDRLWMTALASHLSPFDAEMVLKFFNGIKDS